MMTSTNKLERLAEFRQVLADYHVSEDSKRILRQTQLVLLIAPSSAGRNTIIRELLKTGEYHFIISDTTRQPRVNDGVVEKSGVEYWFRSEEEVLKDLQSGKYLEAAVIHNQQVSGISIRELDNARQEGKIAITDIEVVGAHNIMQAKPDTVAIFVLPPSFDEWMSRLKNRGELSDDEIRRRLESAAQEFAVALEHNYYEFVANDELQEAVSQIHQLARFNKRDPGAHDRARQLAEQLYIETKVFLGDTIST